MLVLTPFLDIIFPLENNHDDFVKTKKNARFRHPSKSTGRQKPPTPASVRRCQTRECRVWPKPELSLPIWIMISPPGYLQRSLATGYFTKNLNLLPFWPAFCQHQKTLKNKHANIHQNLKKSHLGLPMLQFR